MRYIIYIGGYTYGAGATVDLLLELSPRALVRSYLSVSSLLVNRVSSSSTRTFYREGYP